MTALGVFVLSVFVNTEMGGSRQSANDGKIEGRVVDAGTRMSVAQARVILSSFAPNSAPRSTITDKNGSFSFDRLTASAFPYFLNVQHDGFRLHGTTVRKEDANTAEVNTGAAPAIAITPRARVRVELRIAAASIVAGRVLDAERRPVINGSVELIPVQRNFDTAALEKRAATDGDGQFRFGDVLPGEYLVRASIAQNARRTDARGTRSVISLSDPFSATFYPGVPKRDLAARISATAGSIFNSADIVLSPVSSGRISGTIRNSLTFAIETDPTLAGYQRLIAGALLKPTSVKFGKDDASNYSFYLVPKDTTLIEPPVFGPLPDYDDSTETFELRNIPAGTYDLHVVFRPNTGDGFKWHAYSGRTIVNVGDLSVNVGEIQIEPNADVSGQIFLDGSPTVPRIDFGHSFPSLISAEPVPTDLLPGPRLSSNNFVEKDGTFRIPGGVPPGRYWVGFEDWRLPPGVYVDSATMDGRNELGAPVTIQAGAVNRVTFRLRGDGGSVLGIVSDRDRRVIPNATVVLLPVVQRDDASPFRSTSTNERGEFKIDGIRPDAYSLFAVSPGIPDSLLRDSAVVSSFSNQGKKLDVRRNDAIQMNLEAISRQ